MEIEEIAGPAIDAFLSGALPDTNVKPYGRIHVFYQEHRTNMFYFGKCIAHIICTSTWSKPVCFVE